MKLDLIQTFVEYHIDATRRVWKSIDQITEEQFLADDAYSRGSIRNLMVHMASTDRRWIVGLKNLSDIGHLTLEDYATRAAGRAVFETVATELTEYVTSLSDDDLNLHTVQLREPRWQILLHLVNHGTDHRATVLQKLHAFGAPTFSQDFIIWLWEHK